MQVRIFEAFFSLLLILSSFVLCDASSIKVASCLGLFGRTLHASNAVPEELLSLVRLSLYIYARSSLCGC